MTQSPATPLPSPKERRRLREAKHLSQAAIAAKVGVTRETVRSWESGRSTPSGRRRGIYAKLLAEIANEQTVADKPSVRRPSWAKDPDSAVDTKGGKSPERIPVGAAMNGHAPPEPVAGAPAVARPEPKAGAKPEPEPSAPTPGATPAEAFDTLCATCAPGLVRQTYLLTGRRTLAQESVERAFQLAWQRWPEVAVDRDPAGWVRAAAYEYAMSPWHRLRPTHRQPDAPPAEAADRAFLKVLMSLPPAQRRTLLLYDGVGLDLPETAAETEASTPAAANRLLNARETMAEKLPELAATPDALPQRLGELCRAEKLRPPNAGRVRTGSEHRARFWTRAAIAFTALIVGATALTLRTAPTHYEPPQAPGKAISGVPPRMGPGHLTYADQILHKKLREDLSSGPERLTPQLR
ncbi:helix-turn-helix domain-containing protein [Streptomyces sp. BA2]|uniref:helix-turn-helix domain-containing protein n=1 Tax=Streptomyces sp. BA2 TaxID=436595 RepID=UPI001321147F|nr:helix-turn-helix domain-containing protein [Streptomyces sp. BA2]MWA13070.1 helix-turn-helix domain-containing protein [Streptomyces sp. BA2]